MTCYVAFCGRASVVLIELEKPGYNPGGGSQPRFCEEHYAQLHAWFPTLIFVRTQGVEA